MTKTYRIAIVGAGPAGCTLAHLLRKENIEVTIFEGEATSKARTQGGSLDLHTESGIAALKACGLYSEFEKYARYDGEAVILADKRHKRFIQRSGASNSKDSSGRPEIDRTRLRDILADPLSDAGIIRWGYALQSVDVNGTLHFKSGETASGFDLIVGAEGAWSKVRKILTDETPAYSGISGFTGQIPNAPETAPWIDKIVNKGSFFGFGEHRSLSCQYTGSGTINVSFWHACPEDWTKAYNFEDKESIRQALHREYADWDAVYHAMIDAMDFSLLTTRNLYELPIGLTWETKPGFTVIGDAAHLMTPFSGEGVNCAMVDAMELAKTIVKAATAGAEGRDGLSPYIGKFEKEMSKRLVPIQQITRYNLETMYLTPGAPGAVIEKWIIANVVDHVGWYWRYPIAALVYPYFAYVKWRMG